MKTVLRIAIVVALWAPIGLLVGRFASGDIADFSGYDLGAKATGALWTIDSPSLGIPAKPTGEFNIAFSETTLRSGPSGYAIGSIAWPGQVAAGLPSFVQGDIERQSGEELPADIPNYPVRAESFYPQGPTSASSQVGTMSMRSTAREANSDANAHVNAFGFPGVGEMGSQTSMASSGFDPEGVVSMAEAAANDIAFFGGIITIDGVVSRLTARSDGVKASVAGTTTVVGAEVQGMGVTIDATGVHAGDEEGPDSAAAQQAVNQVLNQLGASFELAEPVDTIQGAQGSRALGGLLLRIKSSTLEPLIAALPPDLQSQIRGQVTFDQDMTVQIAPAAVSAGAAKVLDFGVDTPSLPVGGDTGGATTGGDTSVAPSGPTGSAPGGGGVTGGGPVAIESTPAVFNGVPVWLVVLLVLLAFASSRPLTAFADRLFASRAAGRCPYEGN